MRQCFERIKADDSTLTNYLTGRKNDQIHAWNTVKIYLFIRALYILTIFKFIDCCLTRIYI